MNKEAFNRAYELIKIKHDAEKELASLVAVLTSDVESGTVLTCEDKKLRVCQRSELIPAELEKVLSKSMWTSITKRMPVADLIKGAIARGKLDKDLVDSCRKPSKKWLEKR